jgi:MOSC domain-containing protein YiiM
MSKVLQLLIADSPNSPMVDCLEARAVAGHGIEGDRYFTGTGTFSPHPQKPDHEITLIEQESIDSFVRDAGIPFLASQARRNVVTQGIRLNALAGKEFLVGNVRLRGLRLCEPCNYLAKITSPKALLGFVHKGGLRAQILTDGYLRVGDAIVAE